MTIGFDASRAFSINRTGTENYSYHLLLNLSRIDTQNNYIVYVRPGIVIREKWPSNFKFKSINFKFLWTQLGLATETFKDSLDILFVPAHTLPLIKRPGLKTIMTVHDLGAEYLPGYHQLKQKLYLNFITKFQLKTATKLIAVSEATKIDLIDKVGVNSHKVKVIYEGIDRNLFKPIRGGILVNRLKYFDLKNQGYFLFVGTIQPRKNLIKLIEAFQFISNADESIKLVLVGSKGWLSDAIYQLPSKMKIEKKVKFLDRVGDKDLPCLYSGAIALIFPSLFEGFGLPILEAFSCHCPVVTSKTSSMPEVGGPAALYVDPYRVDDIVSGMRKVLDLPTRNKLIVKGLEQIKKFNWNKTAEDTLKLFYEV